MADNFSGEPIGSLYVEITARTEKLKKDLERLREKMEKSSKDLSSIANVKPNLDDTLIKRKISDLLKEHKRLKSELEQQIKLDVNADKLIPIKKQIADVERTLSEAGVNIGKVPKNIEDAVNRTGGSIKTLAQNVKNFVVSNIATIGVFIGLQQLLTSVSQAITLSKEQVKAEKQVEQAVRQTGEAAGFTARELYKEASALQTLTGVGDEVTLQNVTKQLLTFTNISGTAFKRAQKAVLDLNAVINQGSVSSLTSQSIQLGKALENPIEGISALSRAGITFTAQQKDLIKTLVASGDVLGAQSIVLDEIEAKYGGQAEALSRAEQGTLQASAAFGDMLERIGKSLLPAINSLSRAFTFLFDSIATEDLDAQSKELETQQIRLNGMAQAITLVNDNEQVRLGLIRDIRREFPEFLKGLDAEKVSNEDIRKEVERLNKEYVKKIQIQRNEEKIAQASNKVADAIEGQQKSAELLGKELNRINKRYNLGIEIDVSGDAEGFVNKFLGELQNIKNNNPDFGIRAEASGFIDLLSGYQKALKDFRAEQAAAEEELRGFIAIGSDLDGDQGSGGGDKKTPIDSEIGKIKVDKTQILKPRELFNPSEFDKVFGEISTSQAKVFDQLKFKAQGYLGYRIKQIYQETDELIKSGAIRTNAESLAIEKIKALYSEYFAYLEGKEDARVSKAEESLARIVEAQESNFDLIGASYDSIQAGADELFSDIEISAKGANSALEKGFVSLANTFISQVKRMISQWLAFQALKTAAGFLGIALPNPVGATGGSFVGSARGIKKAATGGDFIGSLTGVKNMATGGSFIVPPGFQSDSFPLMVQSGERVSVTPAGRVASQDMMIQQIKNSIGDLGAMILANRQRFEFRANINGALSGNDIRLSYDRTKRQSGRFK